jgi:hypothetical protein
MAEAGGDQAQYRVVEDPAQRFAIEQTRMTLEAGWLGRFFGSAVNAPTNIAGLVIGVLTLTIIAIGLLFVPSSTKLATTDTGGEFLGMLAPVPGASAPMVRLFSPSLGHRPAEGVGACRYIPRRCPPCRKRRAVWRQRPFPVVPCTRACAMPSGPSMTISSLPRSFRRVGSQPSRPGAWR